MAESNKTSNKTDILKKSTIAALEKSLGVVTTTCKAVGIARSTFYEWYANDIDFKNDVDDIKEIAIDFAETSLHRQIKDGNTTATIFFLKTQGRKRGYIEQMHIVDDTPQDVKESSDSVLKNRIRNMAKLLLDDDE